MTLKISVVIPTFNRAKLLNSTLNNLIDQSYPKSKYEIIVVDDIRSSDEIKPVINNISKKFNNIVYIRQKNSGTNMARNMGIARARGEIIAFTDDDCLVDRNWLKTIDNIFFDKSISGAEGMTIKTPKNAKVGPFSHYIINEQGGHYLTCNMAYRAKLIKKIKFDGKFFSEKTKITSREDSDAAFSVLDAGGKIIFSKNMVVRHMVYDSTWSKAMKRKMRFFFDPLLFKKHSKFYRKIIKYPFEMFTPFYFILLVLGFISPVFLLGIFAVAIYELHYRKWSAGIIDYFKFVILQSIGCIVLIIFFIYGCIEFRVNPVRFFI